VLCHCIADLDIEDLSPTTDQHPMEIILEKGHHCVTSPTWEFQFSWSHYLKLIFQKMAGDLLKTYGKRDHFK
jgi:hypothetical protein